MAKGPDKRWSQKWAELRDKMETEGTLDSKTRLLIGRKIEQAKTDEKAQDAAAKNKNFKQVYQRGWNTIAELAVKSPGACRLYAAIARSIDERFGAVIATQEALGEMIGMHSRNVRIHADYLEKNGFIVRFRAGGATAYCIDPAAVWCGRDDDKDKAAFILGVIASKNERAAFKIRCIGTVGKRGRKPIGDADDRSAGEAEPEGLVAEAQPTGLAAERARLEAAGQITIFDYIDASLLAETAKEAA